MMRTDRRAFLKVAGLALLGLGLKPSVTALAGVETVGSSKEAARATRLVARRWAMVVDVPKCIAQGACTDCITACNKAHNIPRFDEPKDQIKWIWREPYENAFPDQGNAFETAALQGQALPVLCNHCDNPPCVRVCPTQATWKRPDGIVMIDEHRCIGCRYCMVACPYGSRSFNFRDPRQGLDMEHLSSSFPTRTRGVVEKCNFCAERVDVGQMPACVEACPQKALFFGDVQDPGSDVRRVLQARYSMRRNPALGTNPQVYYVL